MCSRRRSQNQARLRMAKRQSASRETAVNGWPLGATHRCVPSPVYSPTDVQHLLERQIYRFISIVGGFQVKWRRIIALQRLDDAFLWLAQYRRLCCRVGYFGTPLELRGANSARIALKSACSVSPDLTVLGVAKGSTTNVVDTAAELGFPLEAVADRNLNLT
nr:hypothetical protein CFP56_57830 [Quercus suber]